MTVLEYINNLNLRYKTGISTEHSYRSDLLGLIESLSHGLTITNEPKRIACGAPDYIIAKRNIPIGYIEAKDIGADLSSKTYKEQFDRYRLSLDNLIITDYLTFQFFVNGAHTTTVTIGEVSGNKVHPIYDNFNKFIDLIKNFCEFTGQTIKSAQKLSKMMAAKARLLANVIELALDPENENEGVNELQNINLLSQYESFKQVLIHDITPKAFADIYAQTIAYGMFAARLNDPSLENFTRQEAAELIPKSNPFLRKLFQYIAGYDLDDRIVWLVDALADIFRATNVEEMLKDFGKSTQQTDPFIHFYETFLAEYDPKLRKSRGVWYTPEPVVNFIVRAVDDILKAEFGLTQGLADTSKIKIKVPGQEKKPVEKEVHKVQILDPAAGTGTFLAEVIKQVHAKFEDQQGIWSQYVDDHLIPRLNGFEILMASYAMAHLKLEMFLQDTGYKPQRDQRLRIYLTNSLEEHHPDTGTLFANWLSTEANEANHVKRDTPVMCVIGNPPYSGVSTNKGKWITNLIEDYKFIDGIHFGEKKHWLQDDYVKFLRFGEFLVSKNGSGVLAFINNHSFLDNPTFRGMRWHLLNTFDKIYVIDLHGNTKTKETSENGANDTNVFDIMQGVSINIFIKTNNFRTTGLGKVLHYGVFGPRESKYNFLFSKNLTNIGFQEITPEQPFYFLIPKIKMPPCLIEESFKVDDLFNLGKIGICTQRDSISIQFDKTKLVKVLNDLKSMQPEEFRMVYKERKDGRDWKVLTARRNIVETNGDEKFIRRINYRIFDKRWTYYTNRSKGFIAYPRFETLRHLVQGPNVALVLPRQLAVKKFKHAFVTDEIFDQCYISNLTKEGNYSFPLYLYSDHTNEIDANQIQNKIPNLNEQIISEISKRINLRYTKEDRKQEDCFNPIEVFDYVYAVLYSQQYRDMYEVLLQREFPYIPFPKDTSTFKSLSRHGSSLRKVHLLEEGSVGNIFTSFPLDGSNEIEFIKYTEGKLWINDQQYFKGIPLNTWEFYIGGYQPAQKWLKDRKGRVLSFEDIMHYQKIIVALTETERIMKEIDKIDFLP